ncbi:hypothetical protein KUCAC02_024482, partial [Chaenocephalus aceratus]
CTAEVAHFSLQWWADPSSLKHRINTEGYSELCSQLSSPSFKGVDSFYVRVDLNMEPHVDPPSLGVSCDDIAQTTIAFDNHNKGPDTPSSLTLKKGITDNAAFRGLSTNAQQLPVSAYTENPQIQRQVTASTLPETLKPTNAQ